MAQPVTSGTLVFNGIPAVKHIGGRDGPDAVNVRFGAGYGLLFLIIALVPYRRGDVWAWWAILAGTIVTCSIILLRNPVLGTNLGLGALKQ